MNQHLLHSPWFGNFSGKDLSHLLQPYWQPCQQMQQNPGYQFFLRSRPLIIPAFVALLFFKVSISFSAKNLELFIPYAQIPELNGKKVIIEFAVYLDDVKNKQWDRLMYNTLTTPLSIPR